LIAPQDRITYVCYGPQYKKNSYDSNHRVKAY
jgi:hypothetical protein